jgi:hypothetical protein
MQSYPDYVEASFGGARAGSEHRAPLVRAVRRAAGILDPRFFGPPISANQVKDQRRSGDRTGRLKMSECQPVGCPTVSGGVPAAPTKC